MNKAQFPIILFIDGHTSHINLPVSEFCRNHNIILYCFPAHASHILQPLDVTVFGPLKKMWNDAIDEFQAKYKTSVTKHSFFQVFDQPWKKATEKKHSVSGFNACGLVPFNPDNVDYRKVLNSKANSGSRSSNKRGKLTMDQRLGITMSFQAVKDILSPDQIEFYEKRMDEDYDLVDGTDSNKLWRIFKTLKLMQSNSFECNVSKHDADPSLNISDISSLEGSDNELVQRSVNIAENSIEVNVPVTVSENLNVSSRDVQSSTPKKGTSSITLELNDTLPAAIDVPSTSNLLTTITNIESENSSYVNYDFSPFKQYLKISDSIIIPSKKTPKRKPKTPAAVSGKDYIRNLKAIQRNRENEQNEKEKRKQLREEKKKAKVAAAEERKKNKKKSKAPVATVTPTVEESDSEEEQVIYASSDELEELNSNVCGACEGNEDWEVGEKWIGCISCDRWFHKSCLSGRVEAMSEEELKKLQFKCSFCIRKNTNK